ISGVEALRGGSHRIGPEHIEVASFIGLAAVTGADAATCAAPPGDLVSIIPAFERLGIRVEIVGDSVHVPPDQELVIRHDVGGYTPKNEDGAEPPLPARLTSIAGAGRAAAPA